MWTGSTPVTPVALRGDGFTDFGGEPEWFVGVANLMFLLRLPYLKLYLWYALRMTDKHFMKLDYLLAMYRPVYPSSGLWAETLQGMLDDPSEKAIVDELVAVLLSGKGLREPVVVGVGEFFRFPEDEADDKDGVEELAVVNGTHRVCAHMLSGVEDVFVVRSEDLPEFVDTETGVETVVTLSEKIANEEEHDDVFGWLRSFPLNDDVWMESSLGSSGRDVFTMFWGEYVTMEDALVVELEAKVRSLFVEHGLGEKVLSVETRVFRWDEND